MHKPTVHYHDTNAELLSARYREAHVADLHTVLERWLPERSTVLEVGCGAGREAAWMAARGLDVTATDAIVCIAVLMQMHVPYPHYRLHWNTIR